MPSLGPLRTPLYFPTPDETAVLREQRKADLLTSLDRNLLENICLARCYQEEFGNLPDLERRTKVSDKVVFVSVGLVEESPSA